jgi:transposase InsO family protein
MPSTIQHTDADLRNYWRKSTLSSMRYPKIHLQTLVMFEHEDVSSLTIPKHPETSEKQNYTTWNGACLDTGAQKTVIGFSQAKAYCRFVGTKFKLKENKNIYRFGVDRQESMGSFSIRLPTPVSIIFLEVDVVRANVPLLIGLDVLDAYGLTADTVKNSLKCPSIGWEIPLVRKLGHVYLEWPLETNILFTKSELTKLHRGFYHPTNENLMNLLKRARPNDLDKDTNRLLQNISKSCETCQRLGPKPIQFKVSLPKEEDLIFGEELSIDLMFLGGKAVLHIVDTATRFSAATFLDSHTATYGQSVEGVWLALIETWFTLYTGYPNRLRTDAGSIFSSPRWRQLSEMVGISLRISGIEAHNSLGIGERLHEPLRRIYEKVQMDYPHISPRIILKITVKVMNDTIGENGLVPSLLVFGVVPRFPMLSTDLPNQKERMAAISLAKMEMNSIIAERRVNTALRKNAPSSVDYVFAVDDEVLVFRERTNSWTGPFKILKVNDKILTVQSMDKMYQSDFNVQQVKPYYFNSQDTNFMRNSDTDIDATLNIVMSEEIPIAPMNSVFITEIIKQGDSRAMKFEEAKKKKKFKVSLIVGLGK